MTIARTAALCVAALAPCVAHAQQAPSEARANSPANIAPNADELQAREAFERGVALARDERWAEALEAFRRSRALAARPSAAFNMASCLVRLGRAIDAVASFEDYFRLVTDPQQEGARYADAQRQMAATRQTIASATVTVSPPDAVITVDGLEAPGAGATRRIALDPRAHRIVVSAARHESFVTEVAPSQGERLTIAAALRRIGSASLSVTATPSNATLLIDAQPARLATALSLVEGRHNVVVSAAEHEQHTQWVTLVAGDARSVHVDLRPARRGGTVLQSPWLWTGVAVGVAAVTTAVVLGVVLSQPPAPYDGTTGRVFQGLSDRGAP
ncbi:MAG: hypothetical protein JNK05_12550 [Myxococcales bacterium]|nr:hypothetical protein [Myxococcales bacterium]